MSENFCTNWNKTLVLASTDVKTYTVQKGERKEKKQTPIQTNFSPHMPHCWWSQLNQIKKQLLSGWQPTVDLEKAENQAKREGAGLMSITEEVRGKKRHLRWFSASGVHDFAF